MWVVGWWFWREGGRGGEGCVAGYGCFWGWGDRGGRGCKSFLRDSFKCFWGEGLGRWG